MPELIGAFLGKVRIDMFLAQGGMADVYLGTHTTLQRAVAVKLMKSQIQNDPDLQERFQREARVVAMLRHPNIVQVFDFDTHLGQPYLVMEYVSGASLANYLRKLHESGNRLSLPQVGFLIQKLADALAYAHDLGVIHRDVKPGNILLTSRTRPVAAGATLPGDTEPILTDFGLVRFRQSPTQTATGLITGTPAYMSPEQARGSKIDSRTDLYSLGVTAYEMLAGRVPFDADSTLTVLNMHINEPPPPIEDLAAPIQQVIQRALAKDPDQRYGSANEFGQALLAAISGKSEAPTLVYPTEPTRVPGGTLPGTIPPAPAPPVPASRPLIYAGAGILGLVVAVSLLYYLNRGPAASSTTPEPTASHGVEATHAVEPLAAGPTPIDHSGGEPAGTPPIVGRFRFQDGTALADQVTISTSDMPPPPAGSQYEAWLIEEGGEQRRSIGVITFDASNMGTLTFVDSQGRNLLGLYHGLEITLEPSPDPSPNPSNDVVYRVNLPPGGLAHVRHLLSAFGGTPNQTALIQGLETDAKLINASAGSMLAAFVAGRESEVRLQAEQILNTIVGDQSPDYKDWNGDGTVGELGDGYGMLLNGENAGYIQGVFSHADFAVTSGDATSNMITHGEHVKIAATNVGVWTPQLRDQLIRILTSPFGPEMEQAVREAAVLGNQIENGIDLDGNERIEPIPGEGGALTAYAHAYYMADLILPAENLP